jgi:aminopeptidase N
MPAAEITRSETRARAELVSVLGYEIELDIAQGDSAFLSTTRIRFDCASPSTGTYVDLLAESAAEIRSITLNAQDLDPTTHYADGRITLPALEAENTLRVVASLSYSTPGFHRSTDPVDGKVYTYTKFEPDHARRVFACFEQPDLKAPFTISVIAPADWTVIATQPTPEPTAAPTPGLARWDFPPTPRLSTYLMHVTAGEYHVVRSTHTTARGQTLPMLLASRASLAPRLEADADELFATTSAGLDYFTTLFDMDFPFEKYDQQFVPNYPAGATEHPAAVTIDDELLFRPGATAAEYEWRTSGILHEMAHMWFGDLVTMQWWDDLWLNESFAEWAGYQASALVTRFTEAWTTFAHGRKSWGYSTDLAPGTHPIAANVATVSEAMANFDGISYAKGAAVLKQLIAFLGEDAFIAGLRTYFAEHAWGNTTLADFLRHLSTAADKDLTAWSTAWLRTARPNTLSAVFDLTPTATFANFAIAQEAQETQETQEEPPTPRPHHLAIGLYQRKNGHLTRVHRIETNIDGPLTQIPELTGHQQPDLLLLNDDDLTYALTRFDERSQATLINAIGEFDHSLPRAVCLTSAGILAAEGQLPLPDFFRLAAAAMEAESSVSVVQSLRKTTRMLLMFLADPAWLPTGQEILASAAERMLHTTEPGSDLQRAAALLLAQNATTDPQIALAEALLHHTAPNPAPIPGLEPSQDLRWTLLTHLAQLGRATDAEIDAELSRDPSDQGERTALAARAAIPDAAHKAAAWAYLTGEDDFTAQTASDIGTTFRLVQDPSLLTPYRNHYFEELPTLWNRRKAFAKHATAAILLPTSVVDPELLEQFDTFLTQHKTADAGLVRSVLEGRDTAARAAASRALTPME